MKTAFAAASLASFLAAPILSSTALGEPAAYEFDKTHTTIKASWTHLGFSEQSIHFTDYEGVLLLDLEEPSNSTIDVTFDLAGGFWVGAEQDRFVGHLNSGDLFNIDAFPTARFVATKFETEDGQEGVMTGNLTLLDQTHPISLDVQLNKAGAHPFSGTQTAGFNASGTLNRSEWGMAYAVPNISDAIKIEISTELSLITEESE